jgi:hypothetical protein
MSGSIFSRAMMGMAPLDLLKSGLESGEELKQAESLLAVK